MLNALKLDVKLYTYFCPAGMYSHTYVSALATQTCGGACKINSGEMGEPSEHQKSMLATEYVSDVGMPLPPDAALVVEFTIFSDS
jgi:hypothetical protein